MAGPMPLIAAVAWAVLVMHSLPDGAGHSSPEAPAAVMHSCCSASIETSISSQRPVISHEPASFGNVSHDMSHVCLAVLTALIAGAVATALRRSRGHSQTDPAGLRRLADGAARPPPRPAGRSLLNAVCVLRA